MHEHTHRFGPMNVIARSVVVRANLAECWSTIAADAHQ